MIKKFDEFINESNEQYILYIRLGERDPRLKDNIEKIIEIGQGDNKTVLTKHNTDARSSIWGYEAFLYPFFERDEAESFISEISNLMDIYEYNIFPATDRNPLMKYFLHR
jgi:hypothetical protein